jgi:hypothetical protein
MQASVAVTVLDRGCMGVDCLLLLVLMVAVPLQAMKNLVAERLVTMQLQTCAVTTHRVQCAAPADDPAIGLPVGRPCYTAGAEHLAKPPPG